MTAADDDRTRRPDESRRPDGTPRPDATPRPDEPARTPATPRRPSRSRRARTTPRASTIRRKGGRRALVPALTALLVPVLNAAPADATPAMPPRYASVRAADTDVPATLPERGGLPAGLVNKIVIYNGEIAGLQQRKTQLTSDKETLTKAAAKWNTASDTYNAKDAACGARITAHNQKMATYNADVDVYNAGRHDFELPAEADAYAASVARKQELDAEGEALHEEAVSIAAEQQELDAEEAQLTAQKSQLTTEMADHNAKGDAWSADQQRLEEEHQELLGEMVTAIAEVLDAPPAQAAVMAAGADAPEPAQPAGPAPKAPGGDAPSRAGQVASLAAYAVANDLPVRFQPGVVRLAPGSASRISAPDAAQLALTATYDGLLPEADGHYRAVEVESGGTGAGTQPDQGRRAFNSVLANGGRATTTVDGRPVVIDGTTTVPRADRSSSCAQGGEGWVRYQATDTGHGGRAQGMTSCLTPGYLATHTGSTTNGDVRPPGYSWAQRYARYLGANPPSVVNNCHLLANILSGSGTDLRNLATCGRDANSPVTGALGTMDNMQQFEATVNSLVRNSGLTVRYTVIPLYLGNRVVPDEFSMSATLWDASGKYQGVRTQDVPDLMTIPSGRKNLGTVIDSRTREDVPTA